MIYLEVPRDLLLERLSGRYICRAHGHVYNIKTNPPKTPGICDIDGANFSSATTIPARRFSIGWRSSSRRRCQLTKYYAKQGKLVTIDGTQSIDDVTREILTKLDVSE